MHRSVVVSLGPLVALSISACATPESGTLQAATAALGAGDQPLGNSRLAEQCHGDRKDGKGDDEQRHAKHIVPPARAAHHQVRGTDQLHESVVGGGRGLHDPRGGEQRCQQRLAADSANLRQLARLDVRRAENFEDVRGVLIRTGLPRFRMRATGSGSWVVGSPSLAPARPGERTVGRSARRVCTNFVPALPRGDAGRRARCRGGRCVARAAARHRPGPGRPPAAAAPARWSG